MTSKKKCLIIEAHSDDSAISCFGFLNKFKKSYEYHFVLIAASDTTPSYSSNVITKEQRLSEYQQYVDYLDGVWHKDSFIPGDFDSKLDTIPKSSLVKFIEKIITQVKPNLLICQGPSFHHDHTIVYETTIAALRPNGSQLPEQILIMENPTFIHSSEIIKDLKPNFYCTLKENEIIQKIELFKKFFHSQIRGSASYISPESLLSWAKYRGLEARKDFAEAFYSYKTVLS